MTGVPLQFRVAALLLWLSGAGFGLPCLQAIGNLLAGRNIPYVMGFPACGKRRGAILSLLLLPAGAVYWWGFALPFGPIFALVRTFLIVQRWNSLRSHL